MDRVKFGSKEWNDGMREAGTKAMQRLSPDLTATLRRNPVRAAGVAAFHAWLESSAVQEMLEQCFKRGDSKAAAIVQMRALFVNRCEEMVVMFENDLKAVAAVVEKQKIEERGSWRRTERRWGRRASRGSATTAGRR